MMINIDGAYREGMIKGMTEYMSHLKRNKETFMYIPKNEDNTYTVSMAESLSKEIPQPRSLDCIKYIDYDSITEELIKFTAQCLEKIPEKDAKELFDCLEDYGGKAAYIAMTNVGYNAFQEKLDELENAEMDYVQESLSEIAEKQEGLTHQQPFYVNKIVQFLDKNPEKSQFYSELRPEDKVKYATICYQMLSSQSDRDTGMTMHEAFEYVIENPRSRVFKEADKYCYDDGREEDSLEAEEDYDME